MKKVRLTESDLRRIVKRVISESEEYGMDVESDFPNMEVASDEMNAEVDITNMEMGYGTTTPMKIGGVSRGKLWHGRYVYELEASYYGVWYDLYVTKIETYSDGVIVYGNKAGYDTWVGIKPNLWNPIVRHIHKGTKSITFSLDTSGASGSNTKTNAWSGSGGYKGIIDCRLIRTYPPS